MPTQPTRNVLNVFLASPGDVVDERHSARHIVDTINRIYSRDLGWHVELLGWEDMLPGTGRPQEIINADVDACNLFVGIVWARWGSPTGKFDSGFEEEFERARARNKKDGAPEIWLFFKQVDSDRLRDPGPQLQRVQSFRAEQTARREVLYKEFTDDNEWRELFHEALSRYLLKIALPQMRGPSASLPPEGKAAMAAPTAHDESLSPEGGAAASSGHAQLLNLTSVVADALAASSMGKAEPALSLDQFEVARLYLFAYALMSRRYTTDLLGVHQINVLYRHKERLEATGFEQSLLMRTLIGDLNDVVPGCYWFRDLAPDEVIMFLSYAAEDPNPSVRLRAVQILEELNASPSEAFADHGEALLSVLKDDDFKLRKAGFSYLASAGTVYDIPFLDSLVSDENSVTIRNEAILARASIISKTHPEQAFTELLANPQLNAKEFIKLFDARASEISTTTLLSAVRNSNEAIREFTVRELRRRGDLPTELATSMLEDSSEAVREICYMLLIEHGVQVDPDAMLKNLQGQWSMRRRMAPSTSISSEENPNAVTMALFRRLSLEELTKLVDWYGFVGSHAYKARGLFHFGAVADEIKSDLENKFTRIKKESDERLLSKYGTAAEELTEKTDNFTRGEFVVAALAAFAENGEANDVEVGRRYLTDADSDIVYEAVRIIERLGDASDTEALIEIARTNAYSSLGPFAARAALKLSPGVDGAAHALVTIEIPILVQLAVKAIVDEDKIRVSDLIKPLLYSKKDEVRLKALAFFVKRCSGDELETLLAEYLEAQTYFYNVVCHLDRVLYAPAPLRDLCRQDIETELDE
jgi:hypothetical protein